MTKETRETIGVIATLIAVVLTFLIVPLGWERLPVLAVMIALSIAVALITGGTHDE